MFGAPLGLLALLALPAVVGLHLFRRRHRPHDVSALFLWLDAARDLRAGPQRRPLRADPSFWLECAVAVVAALLLADFSPTGPGRAERRVIVLDDSASLSAAAAGHDARGAAVEAAERLIASGGRRVRVSLLRSGLHPALLAGPDAPASEARAALAAWRPSAPDHALDPAIVLARELAGGGTLTLVTDAPVAAGSLGPDVEVVAVGAPLPNVGLVAAERLPAAAGEDRLGYAVRCFAPTTQTRRLRILVEDRELHARSLELAPGAAARFELPLPPAIGAVTIELEGDALAADDRATLPPPPRGEVRVRVELEEGAAEALGLVRLCAALDRVRLVGADEPADLAIGHEPAAPPALSLVLPRNAGALEAFAGPFAAERRWPPLDGVALTGVLWTRSSEFPMPGLPRVAVGGIPLLSEEAGATPVLRLNLVAARSTLQGTPDWPILMSNLTELVRARLPGPRATAIACGEVFRYRAPAPADLRLSGSGLERRWPQVEELALDDLPPADDYVLADASGPVARFAVNFLDAAESDLAGRGSGVAPAAAGTASQARAGSPWQLALLLLLGLLLASDAALLARRGTE